MSATVLGRRDLFKGAAGALVVTLVLSPRAEQGLAQDATPSAAPIPLDPTQLDSYISVSGDGSVTAYFGKMDMGQGVDTGIAQFVADELDVAFERVRVVMGDTALTVNQGGASGATGIELGSRPIRQAAAEARRVLIARAATHLNREIPDLTVVDGVVHAKEDPTVNVSYAELIGDRFFNITLAWNGSYGNSLNVQGIATLKTPDQFKVVGTPVQRTDVVPKIFAEYTFIDKISVPGMVHGRILRPPVAGAAPLSYDESSVADIPGVEVVLREKFIGLVADNEWHAVKAASRLRVTWSDVAPPFIAMDDLFDYIREAPAREGEWVVIPKVTTEVGDVDAAIASASRVLEAEYQWPYMSHASMGPACAVADVREDGVTVWTGSQKPHGVRTGVANVLGREPATVHSIWVHGPGSYGRNDADDCAIDAAILSEAVGKPVRLQYMRHDGLQWDPKGPASIHTMRAAIDENNKITAYSFHAKGFSAWDVMYEGSDPAETLGGQLLGLSRTTKDIFGTSEDSYGFASKRLSWDVIDSMLTEASPLRTAHIRDPQGPQTTFAAESFIDEMAFELGLDPVEFRLVNLTDQRHIDVVRTAAEQAGWESRPSPNPIQNDPEVVVGRGIAYAPRGNTVVAIVCEVEVNRETGRVWPRKFTVAHECGLIVNPRSLKNTVEGAVMQATSRALVEEVQFDESNVTSTSWATYPILDIMDTPEEINVVLMSRPDLPAYGAGEPATKPLPAAIANAIFDATGVRIRRSPFRPERVKAAMDAANA